METLVRLAGIVSTHRMMNRPLVALIVGTRVATGLVAEGAPSGRFKVPAFDGEGQLDGVPVHVSHELPPDYVLPLNEWGAELSLATASGARLVEGKDYADATDRLAREARGWKDERDEKARELAEVNGEWTELVMMLGSLVAAVRSDVVIDEKMAKVIAEADRVMGRTAGKLLEAAGSGRARMLLEAALGIDLDEDGR